MAYIEQQCPRCGAPIPPSAGGVVVCAYCSASLVPTRDGFRLSDAYADEELDEPHLPRFWLGGARYRTERRIGRGESCDVLLARRDQRLTERVVVKVLRVPEDRDLLAREATVLRELSRCTARGGAHFSRLVPQPVAQGLARRGLRGGEGEVEMSIHRFESGFVHSFSDVAAAYPGGVPASAAVWIWKRTLELLAFVHESGFVHGAVLPRHLLVHARDHGVRLCGWMCAARSGEELPAVVADAAAFYPDISAPTAAPALDLAMSARSLLWLLGGEPRSAPRSVPRTFADILEAVAGSSGPATALETLQAVDAAAHAAFGPPKYVPFAMPGWPAPA